MPEADLIASRLATASQCFPLPHSDVDGCAVRDSVVYVEAEGNVITVCVTDYDGTKREYRALVQLVETSTREMRTAPALPVHHHRAGADLNNPTDK